MAAPSFLDPRNPSLRAFIGRLGRSRFFTISVALHFIFVLSFGTVVLVQQQKPHTDFDDPGGGLVAPPPPAPESAIQPLDQPTQEVSAQTNPSAAAPSLQVLSTTGLSSAAFAVPTSNLDASTTARTFAPTQAASTTVASVPKINGIPTAIASKMKGFTSSWHSSNDSGSGVGKDRAFKFTAYLAKYQGGDWDSTIRMQNGKIATGSLPNLLYLMRKWSRDRIDAQPDAEPLDLSGDALFTIKPPFVLFTGHRDFKLSDKEIENLQKYLQLGGCIWGDSSLPGSRSRFDIAFRREMKRVLNDQDINWETLPPDHPIYTKTYYPEIKAVPAGMNFYREPIYALKNFGEVAVIYTANDYCDMWQLGLNEQGQYDLRRDETNHYIAMNADIYLRRDVYFRNCDEPALVNSYKFGTNIILHLLTRWEDKLRNVPTGL